MEALDAVGVRILGSLIEKEATTPDNYPLTLNALTAACNQASNREPVMELDEAAVVASLEELDRRRLVRPIHRNESRVLRYRHALVDTLHLHPAELAILCVLMLRGAQTTGEIRLRTSRLFDFPDLARVEVTLQSLMSLSPPLVALLPRRPGQKEVRYAHLLSGEPQVETTVDVPDVQPATSRLDDLEESVAALRAELAELRARFDEFRQQFQ